MKFIKITTIVIEHVKLGIHTVLRALYIRHICIISSDQMRKLRFGEDKLLPQFCFCGINCLPVLPSKIFFFSCFERKESWSDLLDFVFKRHVSQTCCRWKVRPTSCRTALSLTCVGPLSSGEQQMGFFILQLRST